ncbi:MAG: hypothetical protein IT179_19925 [Acidobacteria bacterium]|nr:hypothetical protein [Acidobacteriota bacterium]
MPALPPPRPAHVRRWRASHTVWLAGALALVVALDAAASADSGVNPLLPMLIAVAAILLVVVVPMALAVRPGEAAP